MHPEIKGFVIQRVWGTSGVRYIRCWYGVAIISRLLKITCLFCKRALYKRRYSAKETYNFEEPTNCSHPIHVCIMPHEVHLMLIHVPIMSHEVHLMLIRVFIIYHVTFDVDTYIYYVTWCAHIIQEILNIAGVRLFVNLVHFMLIPVFILSYNDMHSEIQGFVI